MKQFFFLSLPVMILLPLLSPPLILGAQKASDCTELVKKNCLECHSETRICQKITKQRGKRAWKRTVKTMIRHGATIEKSDQKLIITCLSTKDMPVQQLCGQ